MSDATDTNAIDTQGDEKPESISKEDYTALLRNYEKLSSEYEEFKSQSAEKQRIDKYEELKRLDKNLAKMHEKSDLKTLEVTIQTLLEIRKQPPKKDDLENKPKKKAKKLGVVGYMRNGKWVM